jgi:LacI family transcriptional regulator
MSLVGYDDIEYAAAAVVALTSVHQPRHEIGRTAARLLLDESADQQTHEHRHVEFMPELVVRASTAPPPARSR